MTCAKNRREKPMAARLAWGFTAQKPAFRLPGTPRSLTGRRLLRGVMPGGLAGRPATGLVAGLPLGAVPRGPVLMATT